MAKTCVHCGKDCAGQPRTKDPKGRYYHTACYEQRRSELAERAAVPELAMPDEPAPFADLMGDDAFNPLEELLPAAAGAAASAGKICPGCQAALGADAVLCIGCGYDLRAGEKTKVKKAKRAKGAPSPWMRVLASPWVIGLLVGAAFGGFYLYAQGNEDRLFGFILLSMLFVLVMSVHVIVSAFRESIVTGLLTLIVPLYALYFLFFVNEKVWNRILYMEALVLFVVCRVITASMAGT